MFLHIVGFPSFLRLDNIPLYIQIAHVHYLSIDEYLHCFHVLVTVNITAMNMGEQIFL